MRKRVAIVGSGPTALYALKHLIECKSPLSIAIFEAAPVAGKGTPYQRGVNSPEMLSNIPSIEIPELPQDLVGWLTNQPDTYLDNHEIGREAISDRAFYPRVVIGDYFQAQFLGIVDAGRSARHDIIIHEGTTVNDVVPHKLQFDILAEGRGAERFDYVVIATGHSFPSAPETSPGYFCAPWPATALQSIPSGKTGVLGTSLSAIDAVVTLAASFGQFSRLKDGRLQYALDEAHGGFHVMMMSRKGLLPEADFYFPIPYEKPLICTEEAVAERIALGGSGLLDDVFDLFRMELQIADPDYADRIGLPELTVDSFASAYYGVRDQYDPFEWAEQNLTEAKENYRRRCTVGWRYAILITHEIIESAVGGLNADDLARFNKSFKSIFADDYATVPHLSIERLLALHKAKCLDIMALSEECEISADEADRGAVVSCGKQTMQFDTFIDATGQKSLHAEDLPFPSLRENGLVSRALTLTPGGNQRRTGGIDVDDQCRPLIAGVRPVRRLYVPAVSYLLHKRPFIQGITSAAELGQIVAESITSDIMRPVRSLKARTRGQLSVAA